VILIGTILTVYVAFNDYGLIPFETIVNNFENNGTISSNFADVFDVIYANFLLIPEVVDYLWFASFLSMVVVSVYLSYRRDRDTYYTIIKNLTFLLFVVLLFLSIFTNVIDYFRTVFFDVILANLSVNMTYLEWYLDNITIITSIIILLNILANYIDLNFNKFNQKKQLENDEL